MRKVSATLTILFLFAAFLSAAESAKTLYQKGTKAEAREDYEAAYEFYKAAYQQKPEELKYRVPYERTRMLAASAKIKHGQKLRDAGNLADALAMFQQAVEIGCFDRVEIGGIDEFGAAGIVDQPVDPAPALQRRVGDPAAVRLC